MCKGVTLVDSYWDCSFLCLTYVLWCQRKVIQLLYFGPKRRKAILDTLPFQQDKKLLLKYSFSEGKPMT